MHRLPEGHATAERGGADPPGPVPALPDRCPSACTRRPASTTDPARSARAPGITLRKAIPATRLKPLANAAPRPPRRHRPRDRCRCELPKQCASTHRGARYLPRALSAVSVTFPTCGLASGSLGTARFPAPASARSGAGPQRRDAVDQGCEAAGRAQSDGRFTPSAGVRILLGWPFAIPGRASASVRCCSAMPCRSPAVFPDPEPGSAIFRCTNTPGGFSSTWLRSSLRSGLRAHRAAGAIGTPGAHARNSTGAANAIHPVVHWRPRARSG